MEKIVLIDVLYCFLFFKCVRTVKKKNNFFNLSSLVFQIQSKAKQNKAKQSKAKQSKAEQCQTD